MYIYIYVYFYTRSHTLKRYSILQAPDSNMFFSSRIHT